MIHSVLQIGPLLSETEAALTKDYEVHRYDRAEDKSTFLDCIASTTRVIATRGDYQLGDEVFAKLPKLQLVASSGAGYDGIDVIAARRRGISVTHTPGVVSECVADLAFGLVLSTVRRIVHFDAFVRQGRWQSEKPDLGSKVWGERIGIIGLGGIGRAIARRAGGFGMDVGYFGRSRQADIEHRYFSDIAELATWARFLVIAVPGGAATKGLVSSEVLRALGADGYLFNVARGSVVDEQALIRALAEGAIAGAGLDVFANEPLVPDALLKAPNVVLQPHIGSGSKYTRIAMGQCVLDNIAAYFDNRPLLTPVA
ncbi:2-hydroxyacid dehydrogenase [Paracoccus onubensis]|uniref:2-hydroxyacid dehydrogenase n=1 Tax=Paracoccus onubensis TaxID=1675788 RepID=A0A418SN65_9RHOB|nr:2-hydroxyacid dehydrogenase [Paracoccus onubensis]RJE82369.1 2-hydroxyacid dehydrogenase [Paracoccus onubensis]